MIGRESLTPNGAGRTPTENIDVSVTHWAGQYVPQAAWPAACGPDGYSGPPVTDPEGKDCNVFHGDYTGLAVGGDGSVNVVWTGLNRFATSPQTDAYTGLPHDGYAQDAIYAAVFDGAGRPGRRLADPVQVVTVSVWGPEVVRTVTSVPRLDSRTW